VPELPRALGARVDALPEAEGFRDAVRMRAGDLVAYQDEAYADRFLRQVERVVAAESALAPGSVRLAAAVADGLHRFMAYKDEYEVARLLVAPETDEAIRAAGGDPDGVVHHLHPPMLRALGMGRKLRFGRRSRRAFRALAAGRRLRGTALDPFGRAGVRRVERELIGEYDALIDRLIGGLRAENLVRAAEIAGLADRVRGYEDLKLRRVDEYRSAVREALADYG
jgi:indolepyruvate ferredoxin oxidoreductase